jgi:hypothetical protein
MAQTPWVGAEGNLAIADGDSREAELDSDSSDLAE